MINTVADSDLILRNFAQEATTATAPTDPDMITRTDLIIEAITIPETDTNLQTEITTTHLIETDTILPIETAIVQNRTHRINKDAAITRDRHPETETALRIDPLLAQITETNPLQALNTHHKDQE